MKKVTAVLAFAIIAVFAVASVAIAAVSSPCGSRPAPARPAPAPKEQVQMEYRRDVLGQRTPIYTHPDGDSMTDEATKYESTITSGIE